MDPIHQNLLREAVNAAKEGDIEGALTLAREVAEQDPAVVQAWMLIGRLSPDEFEKRVALMNVLQLKPNNEQARALLSKMDKKPEEAPEEKDEILPGISRSTAIIGAGVIGLVLVVILFLVISVNNDQAAQEEEQRLIRLTEEFRPTQLVLQATDAEATAAQALVFATETQIALVSPTPSPFPTSAAPTLPPSATPTAAPTQTATPVPPPADLIGRLLGWRGSGGPDDDLQLVRYDLSNGEAEPLDTLQGRGVQLFPDNSGYLYTQYDRDAFEDEILSVPVDFSAPPTVIDQASGMVPYSGPSQVSLSSNGTLAAYVATPLDGSSESMIFVYDFTASPEQAIRQITTDDALYSYPVISPDNSRLIAVRTVERAESPGTDLVSINLNTLVPESLTTDRDAIVETTPAWSPDGTLLFFGGVASGEADQDIYMMNPNNPDGGTVRVDHPADDIQPVIDVTGQYMAFASDRDGDFDIYILQLTTNEVFRLTNDDTDNYPSDWR
jgi:hypothetical protein